MKKKLTNSLLVSVTVLGTSTQVLAMDYDSATDARSNSEVKLLVEEITIEPPGPVDPTDPPIEGPEDPGKPNPYPGQFKINYVSDFKFGEWIYTGHELQVNAQKDQNFRDSVTQETLELPPFVSIKDDRDTHFANETAPGTWTLQAEIKDHFASGDVALEGEKVTLKIYEYEDLKAKNPDATINQSIEIGADVDAATVIEAKNMKGSTSIGFDPATLTIPAKQTNIVEGTYSTEILWTLSNAI